MRFYRQNAFQGHLLILLFLIFIIDIYFYHCFMCLYGCSLSTFIKLLIIWSDLNNKSVPYFIKIGQHLGEWRPKNPLSAYIRGGHGRGMGDYCYSTVSFKLMRLTVSAFRVFVGRTSREFVILTFDALPSWLCRLDIYQTSRDNTFTKFENHITVRY